MGMVQKTKRLKPCVLFYVDMPHCLVISFIIEPVCIFILILSQCRQSLTSYEAISSSPKSCHNSVTIYFHFTYFRLKLSLFFTALAGVRWNSD